MRLLVYIVKGKISFLEKPKNARCCVISWALFSVFSERKMVVVKSH